jgi:tetratricopeptide (TPR) repeat protein
MPITIKNFILGVSLIVASSTAFALPARQPDAGKPQGPSDASQAVAEYRREISDAISVVVDGEQTPELKAASAEVLFKSVSNPLFQQLSAEQQREVFFGTVVAAIRIDNKVRARALLDHAPRMDPENSAGWIEIAKLEVALGNFDGAATAVVAFAKKWPALLEDEQDFILELIDKAEPDSSARLGLMQTLFDVGFKAQPLDASDVWYQLALTRVVRGEPEAARAVIARITWPEMLIQLRSDKRFDGLVDPNAEQFNVTHAASRRLDLVRARSILHPDKLQIVIELATTMMIEGLDEGALELTDGVLADLASASGVKYADIDRKIYIMTNRAVALDRLGRTDEALAQFQQATLVEQNRDANIEHVLNLADYYCDLGRADDALATVAKVGEWLSVSGTVRVASIKHCAAVLQGDRKGEDQALVFMRELRNSRPATFMTALLRSNRMDEAAKMVIEKLESPHDRGEMLYRMQDYSVRAKRLPSYVLAHERWKLLMAREDVRNALDKVGRIQQYDIYVPL